MIDQRLRERQALCPRNGVGNRCGQSGMSMLELLITLVLAGIVLGPIISVGFFVMRQHRPAVQAAESSKQLRLFRTVIADDWASAAQIVIDPPTQVNGWPATNAPCNGIAYTVAPTKIRIAMVTSYQVAGVRLRILYRETPNADGSIRVDRQVCQHNAADGALGEWNIGGRPTDGPVYQLDTLLPNARALILPPGSGCNSTTIAPFPPCDMNVTAIGIDGDRTTPFNPGSPFSSSAQRATVRLHQQVGPVS